MQIYKVVMPTVKVVVKSMVKVIAMGVVLPVFASNAWGQSERDIALPSFCRGLDVSDASYEAVDDDTDKQVKIKACQWLLKDEKGREYNANNKKRGNDEKLYFGSSSSKFSIDDTGKWAASRPFMYQEAYLDLLQVFGLERAGNIKKDVEREVFNQGGKSPEDLDSELNLACRADETESAWKERVTKKTEALLEAKLDKELEKEGVDVSELDADAERKKSIGLIEQYRDLVETRTKAGFNMTEMSGLQIINTFEVVEGGKSSIGILARWSNKVYIMTGMMTDNNGNLPESYPPGDLGRTVDEWLTEFENDLSNNLGVRIVFDENGYPLLLAFGHSAQRYYGTDSRKRKRDRDNAKRGAKAEARGLLSDYVAGQIKFSKTTDKILSVSSGYEFFDENGKCSEEEYNSEELRQTTKSIWKSKSELRNFGGIRDQFTTTVKHPLVENANIVVSVMTWSPAISTKPKTVSKEVKPVTEKISGSLSGTVVGDVDDF